MKLLVTHEIQATEVAGRFYNSTGVIGYDALCNYRFQIKDVAVIVRCKKATSAGATWLAMDGEGVSVVPILQPKSVIRAAFLLPKIVTEIVHAIKLSDRYVVRLPGPTGTLVAFVLMAMRKKYGVEFVGHASESFARTRQHLRFKRLYAVVLDKVTRFLVRRAFCVAYRSEYLRKLYPNKWTEHEWIFSGAQLDDEIVTAPRSVESFENTPFRIIFVGRLQAEKGLISLLNAFKIVCEKTDKPLQLHLVGDGPEYQRLEQEARNLGIDHFVTMHGRIPRGPELFSLLDEAHLFVLPSLTEGMPRALIEAMARGLPALGSSAGGIPELLQKTFLFPPGNTTVIAEKILAVLDNSEKLAGMSSRNFEASKAHWSDALGKAKKGFWNEVVKECK